MTPTSASMTTAADDGRRSYFADGRIIRLEDKIMISAMFRVSALLGLVGMVLGIVMGIRQDFALMPAHAHLNLLGFIALFLAALYYRAVPEAGSSWLAKVQGVLAMMGAVLFPIGI